MINTQPLDDTVVVGQTPGFIVAATGTGTLTYQWRVHDSFRLTSTPIPGATGARYFPPPATALDGGVRYSVTVGDGSGTPTDSSLAQLHVSTSTARAELPAPDAATAKYHLDAVNGSDTAGTGSASSPFRTLLKVVPLLRGGETVVLHAGNYDALSVSVANGTLKTTFTDWVTFMAAPGTVPVIPTATIRGNWGGPRADWNGNYDLRVRLVGLTVADGVRIIDANYVRLENCLLRVVGPWNGTPTMLDKCAVAIRGARSVTVQDCEITESGFGINSRGNDLVFRRNHIHGLSNDGVRVTGCDTVLIEGNHIHAIDDGVEDDVAWSTHADGIQSYNEGVSTYPCDRNVNITIRGNRIYHTEAMGLMLADQDINITSNWVVENNVFGSTGGFMIHAKFLCHGFVFRNNSVVHVDGNQFTSPYRTVVCANYDVALPTYAASSGVEIYNNIFRGEDRDWGWPNPVYTARFDHNLYYHTVLDLPRGTEAIVTTLDPFVSPALYDGVLFATCPGINSGSTADAPPADLYGTPRDSRPDMGAYEFVPTASYAAWAAAAGLTGAQALATADPDGDGLANIVEYALHTDPLRSFSSQAPTLAIIGDSMVLTHRRSKTALVDLTYEVSTDLKVWTPVVLTPAIMNPDADGDGQTELIRALLPLSAGDTRKFLRLSVREP